MGVSQQSGKKRRSNGLRIASAWLLVALLAMPGLALALGLGQIVVRSQPGQPLLAEIPVIAANPGELEDLRVRLASPETFRRVGLQPPDTTLLNLQFTVAVDSGGRPVIRVTSAEPPSEPLLTFLLEVDWGEGRLVREFSALLDAPETVAAPVQAIQAPVVAPSNTIERPAPEPEPEPVAPVAPVAVPEPAPVPEPLPLPATPPPAVAATAAPPQSPPVRIAAPPPPPAAPAPGGDYTVRAGDTLSQIASGFDRGGRSLDQAMLALLRANPDAFIGGNINLVRQGAVLRMPQAEELSRYSAGEAAAMVRTQVAQWREARAVAQPPVAAAATAQTAVPAAGRDGAAATVSPEARLEIVPPSSGSGEAGTRSGTQAGGEGRMLQQEIQETQETLAARDAELGELRTRVAELEKIQQQQQQLITMKDSALAAARENLAKANAAQPVAVPQPAPVQGPALWPWMLLGLALVLAGGWWFLRRRSASPRPRLFDAEAMAASMPKADRPLAAPAAVSAAAPGPAPEPAPASGSAPQAPHWTAAPALVGTVPAWRDRPRAPAGFEPGEELSPARQVELARAYVDLGDDAAARDLLREVLDGRDPVAREIAARMLRELE
jgi:pilus assembly protein FimV